MTELDKQLCRVGMMMNVKKTKMMVLNGKIEEPILIRGEMVEEEKKFPYLGVTMSEDSSSCEEVGLRIAKAGKVFRALHYPLWKRKQVSVETKIAIYRAAVLPVLLYGAEVWVLSVKESRRLEVFHRKCLRIILGITKRDHWTNEKVLEETSMCEVGELVTRSRLRWLGHVVRMGEDRLPPRVLYGSMAGKGTRGKPAGRWKDMIAGDLKKREVIGWYDLAKDRKLWRTVVQGERVDAGVRRRRKRMKAELQQGKGEESKEESRVKKEGGLQCPHCGRGFKGKKGGGFQRHVSACGGDDGGNRGGVGGGRSGDGGGGGDSNNASSDKDAALICPNCAKVYKRVYWLKLHLAKCGSLRSNG